MSGLNLFPRRGTTADHPGSGIAYRDVATLARFCEGVSVFWQAAGIESSWRPSHLRAYGSIKKTGRLRIRPFHNSLLPVFPGGCFRDASACGKRADEAVEHAGTGLLICLLSRKHVVPCDLNAIGGVEYIQHGDVLPFGVDDILQMASTI